MAKRVIVGLALVGLYVTMLLTPGEFRMWIFTLAAIVAAWEMGRLFRAKGYRVFMLPAYIFAAAHFLAVARFGYPLALIIWMLCMMLAAAERIFNPRRTTEEAMCAIFALCYPMMLFMALALVISGTVIGPGATVGMLLLFACPLLGDTLAFFVGSYLGRHKLCPHISPKKTVEGSAGGFAGGALAGIIVYFVQGVWGLSLGFWPMALCGLVCGGVGQIGDLFASVLKRWADIKDYGRIFPGHGGVMDRLDSVLMCAPVVLLYLSLAV